MSRAIVARSLCNHGAHVQVIAGKQDFHPSVNTHELLDYLIKEWQSEYLMKIIDVALTLYNLGHYPHLSRSMK